MKLSLKVAMLVAFLMPVTAHALHFTTDTGADYSTDKVATIIGPIDAKAAVAYMRSSVETYGKVGDRVIVIDSIGGMVDAGKEIQGMIEAERSHGVRIVCLVNGGAHSMAFNILTSCDVRLATARSRMLVHKVRMPVFCPNGYGCTAKMLRASADSLDQTDEPYRRANAKAMGMTLADYDLCADNETVWTATTLRAKGYLHGLATIVK